MDTPTRSSMWSRAARHWLVRIVLAALFVVVPLVILQLVAQAAGVGGRDLAPVGIITALLMYVAYVRLVEKRRPIFELAGRGALAQAAAGFALGALLFGATMLVLGLLGAVTIGPGEGWTALAGAFLAALAAAVTEEILMRGILFRILSERFSDLVGLIVSASLFGLLHAPNKGATAVSTVAIALEAGVLLAVAFMITRQLWLPIGLHLAWNFTEGGVFGASVSGGEAHGLLASRFDGPDILTGGSFGPEASIVAVIICMAAAAGLLVVARRRPRPVT